MTDKELLELAAKAAGIVEDLRGGRDDERLGLIIETKKAFSGDDYHFFPSRYWNPLVNDGDALRLAVTLKLDVFFHTSVVEAHIAGGRIPPIHHIAREFYDADPYAATRRAIVRAAIRKGE